MQTDARTADPPREPVSRATLAGLAVALAVPLLITLVPTTFLHSDPMSFHRVLVGLVVHWLNWTALIAIVVFAEKRPLSSIGFAPWRWRSLALGLLAGIVLTLLYPLIDLLMAALSLHSNAAALHSMLAIPLYLRGLLVVTAGIYEETLFRGYAIERLTAVFGNRWLAAIVTIMAFTAAHYSFWGLAALVPIFVISVVITLLYLWRRDLLVNIIAHSTTDGIGLLLLPAISGGHH
jgi:membrane protease YdiL (CAAX protease family)